MPTSRRDCFVVFAAALLVTLFVAVMPSGAASNANASTPGPLIVGNSAAFGGGPIQTYDFSTGILVNSFVPGGASSGINSNGRAVAVVGDQVFYSELANGFGASDAIHIAPFNGGAGGADVGTLPNPAPSVGIQDLKYANGALYALTGYMPGPLQVWKLNPTNGAALAGPIDISSDPAADGFAVLPNNSFLINSGDASCVYSEYDPTTGAPTGSSITVPGASRCTGVDTDGTALYFETDFSAFTKTDLAGNLISRTSLPSNVIEDISLVHNAATCAPSVNAQLEPALPGRAVGMTGSCFGSSEPVDVLVDTEAGAILLDEITASPEGAITGSFQIPNNFLVPLTVNGSTSNVTVPLRANISYEVTVVGQRSGNGVSGRIQAVPFSFQSNGSTTGCQTETTAPIPTSLSLPGPLHASSRWIVHSSLRVKLVSVNWYGAEQADFVPGGLQCQSLAVIASRIAASGFNSVRLPWSNAMLEENPNLCSPATLDQPCIDPAFLRGDPGLGTNAFSIYEAVVSGLGSKGLMVVLDNHSTDAQWAPGNQNGIWWGGRIWDDYNGSPSQSSVPNNWRARDQLWMTDWIRMVTMFDTVRFTSPQPIVVAADLRNEPNASQHPQPGDATYGQSLSWTTCQMDGSSKCRPLTFASGSPGNWATAAEYAGNAILRLNSNLLIMVEAASTNFDYALTQVYQYPLDQSKSNPGGIPRQNLVYSPHAYGPGGNNTTWGNNWGYLLTQNQTYTAPIWVGEWGDCNRSSGCASSFESNFITYLQGADIDWSWWAINGTMSNAGSSAPSQTWFSPETYGLLDPTWNSVQLPPGMPGIQNCTQFPIPTIGCWPGG